MYYAHAQDETEIAIDHREGRNDPSYPWVLYRLGCRRGTFENQELARSYASARGFYGECTIKNVFAPE